MILPIDLWMEFKLNMEALHIARLAEDHPITCQIYLEQRENTPQYPHHHFQPMTTPRDTMVTQGKNS